MAQATQLETQEATLQEAAEMAAAEEDDQRQSDDEEREAWAQSSTADLQWMERQR